MTRLAQPTQDRAGFDGQTADQTAPGKRFERSAAQWVTFGISLLIVLGVVALIVYQQVASGNRAPVVEVQFRSDEAWEDAGVYYVPLEITNRGDNTAQDVRLRLAFSAGGDRRDLAELLVPFLAGGETVQGTIAVPEDPASGTLTVTSLSFLKP